MLEHYVTYFASIVTQRDIYPASELLRESSTALGAAVSLIFRSSVLARRQESF